MKKVLILAAAGLVLAACASNNKAAPSSSAAAARPVITDREFTNLQAPKLNYESDISYEDQLRATGTYIRGIKGKDSSGAGK
ncbi:MAG: hypothetical protein LBI01_03960 [Elusimicrobium sp.]|jgi:ABC-type oligopeptide transport system substrate-binding subunit|nr:hypothetical protein [Elusimicrobium sp.]